MVPPNSNSSEIAKGLPYVGHPAAPLLVTIALANLREIEMWEMPWCGTRGHAGGHVLQQ